MKTNVFLAIATVGLFIYGCGGAKSEREAKDKAMMDSVSVSD